MPALRLALGQTNPVLGDLEGNALQVLDVARTAFEQGADLLAVGECAISGYPIEDLASRPSFLRASRAAVARLAGTLADEGLGELPVIIGHPDGPFKPRTQSTSNAPTAIAQNCASVLHRGAVVARYAKHHLPNYAVFDEFRVFIPGDELLVLSVRGVDVAVIICEDLWRDGGPVERVLAADVGVLLVINGSPFERDKTGVRLPLVVRRAIANQTIVAYVNLVGGQDDLVFDGDSLVVDGSGGILARAPQFAEHLLLVDLDPEPAGDDAAPADARHVEIPAPVLERPHPPLAQDIAAPRDHRAQLWDALVLGTRDYVDKNRHSSVIVSATGGIDAAVCASIAVDALGADRVDDRVARGQLVLSTSNKTALAIGAAAGDPGAGFAPIKDVPRSQVLELARWRNERARDRGEAEPIPERLIALAEGPDAIEPSLGVPYSALDGILDCYITDRLSPQEVADLGFDRELVDLVTSLVDRSEGQRRQVAIGPKVSGMAFGRDRRMPITYRPTGLGILDHSRP